MCGDKLSRALVLIFAAAAPSSIAVAETALVLLILVWLGDMVRQRKLIWQKTPLDLPFLLFTGAAALSVIFSLRPEQALYEFHSFFLIFSYFFVAAYIKSESDLLRLVRLLFYVFSAIGLYASVKHWSGVQPRVTSTTGGIETMAGFCVLLIPFYLAVVSGVIKNKIDKGIFVPGKSLGVNALVGAAGVLMMSLGLVYTFARMGYVAALFGMIVVLLFIKKKRMALLILVPLVVVLATTNYSERWRIFAPLQGQVDEYLEDRFDMWNHAREIVAEHPVTGIGVGVMDSRYNLITNELDLEEKVQNIKTDEEYRVAHLHNTWIQTWVEMGTLGFIALLLLNLKILVVLVRGICKTTDSFCRAVGVGALAAACGFFLAGLVEFNWGDSEVLMTFLLILALGSRALSLTGEDLFGCQDG